MVSAIIRLIKNETWYGSSSRSVSVDDFAQSSRIESIHAGSPLVTDCSRRSKKRSSCSSKSARTSMPRAISCATREIHVGRIFTSTFWIGEVVLFLGTELPNGWMERLETILSGLPALLHDPCA